MEHEAPTTENENAAHRGRCGAACSASVDLPFYVSKATPEEREQKRIWMREQYSLIYDQQRIETPIQLQHVKIRCGCHKLVGWLFMYRCLYCGIWYCKECAEEHFGMRVPPMEAAQRRVHPGASHRDEQKVQPFIGWNGRLK
jgi:hypothetical protein